MHNVILQFNLHKALAIIVGTIVSRCAHKRTLATSEQRVKKSSNAKARTTKIYWQ